MTHIARLVDASYSPPKPLVTVDYDTNKVKVSKVGQQALILPDDPIQGQALLHPTKSIFVSPGEEGYADLFTTYVTLSLLPAHSEWKWEEVNA